MIGGRVLRRVVDVFTGAAPVGAVSGLISDLAGLEPKQALAVGGATFGVAVLREAAGQLRRPLTAAQLVTRDEIARWLTGLQRLANDGLPGDDDRIEKLEERLGRFIEEAAQQNDDKLRAALIRVRAELGFLRDYGKIADEADVHGSIAEAIARTRVHEIGSVLKPAGWFRWPW